jgi:hypothetical protein
MIDSTNLTLGIIALSAILCLHITRRPTQGVSLFMLCCFFLPKQTLFSSRQLTDIPTYGPSGGPIFGIYNSFCLLLRGRKIIDDAHALISSNSYGSSCTMVLTLPLRMVPQSTRLKQRTRSANVQNATIQWLERLRPREGPYCGCTQR